MSKFYRFHNEFDMELIVCEACAEIINEGITDDRERYYSPVEVVALEGCEICGEGRLAPDFQYGDQVHITSCVIEKGQLQEIWWDDVYIYLCRNTRGDAVLEEPSTGEVFTTKTVRKYSGN